MPATITVLRNPPHVDNVAQKAITRLVFDWVADGVGDVNVATIVAYSGEILRVVTIPSAIVVPNNLYDVELRDSDGIDLLLTGGANRSDVNTEQFCPHLSTYSRVAMNSVLTIVVANAGATRGGQLIIYIE